MNGKTLTLAALAATLLVGTSATASFARQGYGERHGRGADRMFVHMLQELDANKDGKISKEEGTAGQEKMFAAIDANTDGVLTPGEMRKHREAMMEAAKADRKAAAPTDTNEPKAGTEPKDAAEATDETGPQGAMMDDDDSDMDSQADRPRAMDGHGPRGKHHDRAMRHDGRRGHGPDGRHGMERRGPMGGMGMMRMLDTDESGQISKEEAAAATDKMFTRMDTNKDGVISADDMPKAHFWAK